MYMFYLEHDTNTKKNEGNIQLQVYKEEEEKRIHFNQFKYFSLAFISI